MNEYDVAEQLRKITNRIGFSSEQFEIENGLVNFIDKQSHWFHLDHADLTKLSFKFGKTFTLVLDGSKVKDLTFLPKIIDGDLLLRGMKVKGRDFLFIDYLPVLFIAMKGTVQIFLDANGKLVTDEERKVEEALNSGRDGSGRMPRELIPSKINILRDADQMTLARKIKNKRKQNRTDQDLQLLKDLGVEI
jgi:hypothetical protein